MFGRSANYYDSLLVLLQLYDVPWYHNLLVNLLVSNSYPMYPDTITFRLYDVTRYDNLIALLQLNEVLWYNIVTFIVSGKHAKL